MVRNELADLLRLPYWVFDMDGVLVDSTPLHAQAFREIFAEIGISFQDYSSIAGRSTWEAVEAVLTSSGREATSQEIENLVAAKQERALELMADGAGMRIPTGVDRVLSMGQKLRKHLCLVTSAARRRVSLTLDSLALNGLFQQIVTAEDVERGKPDPAPYLALIERTGENDHSHFLVFEDSASGVASALAAGMRVVHFAVEKSKLPEADAAISSFEEVLSAARALL